MAANSKKPTQPRYTITVDAVPLDEEGQQEFNRIMRRPGEPGYVPRAKRIQATTVKEANATGSPESKEGTS